MTSQKRKPHPLGWGGCHVIGSWDIELDIIVKDNQELHVFMRDLKTQFGEIIGKHTFISAVEERMLNPLRGE
ncbi:hypothetical protein HY988_02995 [Candidatus Micrarchaeota archaeon]|nr:hypothetical protein [Candidatus Micrarchaeota archaeon]